MQASDYERELAKEYLALAKEAGELEQEIQKHLMALDPQWCQASEVFNFARLVEGDDKPLTELKDEILVDMVILRSRQQFLNMRMQENAFKIGLESKMFGDNTDFTK